MGNHSGNAYNFLIVFFVALGSFTYGFNSAVIGSVLGLPSFLNYFKLNTSGPDSTSQSNSLIGATNGLYAAGGVIGCWIVPSMLNARGRRLSIQIISLICVISAVLQTASVNIAMMLVGRFINGIGVGMMDVSVPIYQSEISPPKARGRMVGSHGFLVVCGYAMAGWAGYGCFFITNQQLQWRLCLSFQIIAPLLLLAGSFWMPESPRWLCLNNRDDDAFEVLRKFHHTDEDVNDNFARRELHEISISVAIERQETQGHPLKTLLTRKTFRKRLLMAFFVQCIAQSTGVLVVNNYQVMLYNALGLRESVPLLLYACYDTWAAIMNFVNSLMLDRWGRIRIMVIGLIGCSLSLSGFAAMVAEYAGTSNKIGNGFGVFFLYLFVTFYGGSMDASSYVYCAEIFPNSVRAQGVGISVSGLFIMTLIYTQSAPVAFASIGWKYYLVFIILPWVGVFVMGKLFPETAGLSLEEIAGLFGDGAALGDLSGATTPGASSGEAVPVESKSNTTEHQEIV